MREHGFSVFDLLGKEELVIRMLMRLGLEVLFGTLERIEWLVARNTGVVRTRCAFGKVRGFTVRSSHGYLIGGGIEKTQVWRRSGDAVIVLEDLEWLVREGHRYTAERQGGCCEVSIIQVQCKTAAS